MILFDGNTPLGYAKEEKKPNAIGALTTVMKELGIKTDGVFSSGEASSASSKPQLEKQPSFIGSIKEGVSSLFSSFSSSDGSKTVSATSSPSSSSSSSASSSSSSSASSAAKSTPASFQLQKRDFVNYIDLVLKDEDSPTNYANANVLLAEKTDEQKNEMASQQTFSEDPSLIDCSLLQAAVIKNNKVLVNWLLKNGANVNFTNSVSKNLNAQKKAITLVQANNTGNLIKKELIQAGAEDPDAPATPSPSVNPSSGPFVRAEGSVDSSSSSFADKVGKFGGVSTAATASARAPKKENGSRLKIERRKSVGSARGMPEETPSVSKPPVQPPQTSLAKAKEEAAENQLMSRAFDALHQSFRYQRPLTQDNFGQAIKEMQEKCQPYLSRGEE